jgi:hypothetical protein
MAIRGERGYRSNETNFGNAAITDSAVDRNARRRFLETRGAGIAHRRAMQLQFSELCHAIQMHQTIISDQRVAGMENLEICKYPDRAGH